MLCSVVKHAGCGQSTKEVSGETRDLVECFNTLIEPLFQPLTARVICQLYYDNI